MLVEKRRRRDRRRAPAVELERRTHRLASALDGCLDRDDEPEVARLWIVHDRIDVIDRREWHVMARKARHPFCERPPAEARIELRAERLVVLDPQAGVR